MSIRWGQARVEIASLREYIATRLRNGYTVRKIYDLLRDERRITMSRRRFYHYVQLLEQGRLTFGSSEQYDPTETYREFAKDFAKDGRGKQLSPKASPPPPGTPATRAVAPLPAPKSPRDSNNTSPVVVDAGTPRLGEMPEPNLDKLWGGDPDTTEAGGEE